MLIISSFCLNIEPGTQNYIQSQKLNEDFNINTFPINYS